MYDIIIRNGRVIDPQNKFDAKADVAIYNGKIVGVGDYQNAESDRVLDAAGHIVTPGLIDAHAHLWPLTKMGISTECTCIPSAVTTAIDAGSAGWATYETSRGFINTCKVRVKTLVNVSPMGLPCNGYLENVDPDYLGGVYEREIEQLFDRYRGELIGIKLRVNTGVIKDMGEKPLLRALELAERCHTRLVIHSSETAIPFGRLCDLLRKDDILTHMYNKRNDSILLGPDGKVRPEAWEARKRGVLFDVGHAQGHCDVSVAKAAIEQGFLPDMIGTDACEEGAFREHLMFSMPFILSKMLSLGLSLTDAISATTEKPAKWISMEDQIGCLSAGSFADVAIFDLKDKDFTYRDRGGAFYTGHQLLKPVATIKDGQVVYRDLEF